MRESFYVYEEQFETKCERCNNADAVKNQEYCNECIHEMRLRND